MFLWRKSSAASSGQHASGAQGAQVCAALPSTILPTCTVPGAAHPDLAQQLELAYRDVAPSWPEDSSNQQLPIVYHPRYNITLFGIEKLHPFDSCKFEKCVKGLQQRNIISGPEQLVQPAAVSYEALQQVHTPEYLRQLQTSSMKVAQVTELAPLALLRISLVDRQVLQPMRLHVGGTLLASALAITKGWAINLGGGMHHAHRHDGAGWCPYADITLAVHRIRAASQGEVQRVMVIDLDVHQGNGVERDKLHWEDRDLCIVDLYNGQAFPLDNQAKAGIGVKVELAPGTGDDVYLSKLRQALDAAAVMMPQPHLIIYNAGTDILSGDPLGRLNVSPAGVVQRDAAVWQFAREQQSPIVMLLSGGYTRASAGVIVDSISSLLTGMANKQGNLGPAAAAAGSGS